MNKLKLSIISKLFLSLYEVCKKRNRTKVTKNFMLNPNYKVSPSKLPPSSLTQFPILLCHASMHSWKDSTGILRSSVVAALLMVSISGKWIPLNDPLELGKKREKNHTEPGRWVGRLQQHGDALLGKKVLDAQGISWWRSQEFSCHSSHLFSRTGSLCRRAGCVSGPVARTLWGQCPLHRITRSTCVWLLCFQLRTLPLIALALDLRVVIKDTLFITGDDST